MIELNIIKPSTMVQEIDKMYEEVQEEYFNTIAPLYSQKSKTSHSNTNREKKELLWKYTKYLEDTVLDIKKDKKLIESTLIDAYYRLAMIYNIKGMLCLNAGIDISKIPYFDTALYFSNKADDKAFNLWQPAYRNDIFYSSALSSFCKKDYSRVCFYLNSIDFSKYNNCFICNILAGLPLELSFYGRVPMYPAIIKYKISAESKRKIINIINSTNVDDSFGLLKPDSLIGYADFLTALSNLYVFYVKGKNSLQQAEMISDLKSIILDYVHFTPSRSDEITSDKEKLDAFFYNGVFQVMHPALKRNIFTQNKINLTCATIFQNHMISSIQSYIAIILENEYDHESPESEVDYARGEGFDIDDDGNWIPSENDD